MLQSYKVTKRKSATSCGEIADVEWLTSFCSECYRAVPRARGSSEGGQGSREDADDDLQDGLPSLFFHGVDGLRVKEQKSSQNHPQIFFTGFRFRFSAQLFVCDFWRFLFHD